MVIGSFLLGEVVIVYERQVTLLYGSKIHHTQSKLIGISMKGF